MSLLQLFVYIYLVSVPLVWFLSYGLHFAYFQGEYPTLARECYREDVGYCLIIGFLSGISSIFGLMIVLCTTEFAKYGFKLK